MRRFLKDNARNYRKRDLFKELHPLLGSGLLTSDGDLWKRQRRLVAPEFTFQNVYKFAPMISSACEKLSAGWTISSQKGEVMDIAEDMMALTIDIAGAAFFGAGVGNSAKLVGQSLVEASSAAIKRMNAVVRFPAKFPTPNNNNLRRRVSRL